MSVISGGSNDFNIQGESNQASTEWNTRYDGAVAQLNKMIEETEGNTAFDAVRIKCQNALKEMEEGKDGNIGNESWLQGKESEIASDENFLSLSNKLATTGIGGGLMLLVAQKKMESDLKEIKAGVDDLTNQLEEYSDFLSPEDREKISSLLKEIENPGNTAADTTYAKNVLNEVRTKIALAKELKELNDIKDALPADLQEAINNLIENVKNKLAQPYIHNDTLVSVNADLQTMHNVVAASVAYVNQLQDLASNQDSMPSDLYDAIATLLENVKNKLLQPNINSAGVASINTDLQTIQKVKETVKAYQDALQNIASNADSIPTGMQAAIDSLMEGVRNILTQPNVDSASLASANADLQSVPAIIANAKTYNEITASRDNLAKEISDFHPYIRKSKNDEMTALMKQINDILAQPNPDSTSLESINGPTGLLAQVSKLLADERTDVDAQRTTFMNTAVADMKYGNSNENAHKGHLKIPSVVYEGDFRKAMAPEIEAALKTRSLGEGMPETKLYNSEIKVYKNLLPNEPLQPAGTKRTFTLRP